jgi:hypothetical protein
LDGGSSIQGEDENPSAVGYREALRHRVYTIWHELSEVPMSSPPQKVLTLDISRRLLSDLAQVDWLKTNPSTGFVLNKAEYFLLQDGYPFPRE